ncbi:hypothetical protein ACFFUB_09340 [Algimonas porphyrae]|uniref:Uncharacterized protein n=1 Tax=Algimonas porphyrae TaxID=1128113 RepID=A0ABQ5V5Y9_9PROT|nr:hypothetical protein [Algimonas porphyrae]GLQ21682.1 hypothetical protein GCM10007854_26370 [Algimonas porphyrae]
MILRRIRAHIEAENWFAVFLDFAIVVIGVFIGIQVANWNEDRAVERDQRAMLEQLYADLAPRLEGWREGNEVYAIEEDASERFVLDALLAGTLDETDKARFESGLMALVRWQLIDVSLLQRRMESTELFSEFQGTAYEDILVNLYSNWARTEDFVSQYENRGHDARNIIFNRIFMKPGPYNPRGFTAITPEYVFDELVQDREFRHAVAQLYHYNNQVRAQVYQAFVAVDDTVLKLEAALYPDGNTPDLNPAEPETD